MYELRKFVAPEFIFGVGARHEVGRYALNFGARRALVVTDPGVIDAGWVCQLADDLEAQGIAHALFTGVAPNPRDYQIMAGAQAYAETECDVIIALGGGSSIDCAKGIAIVAANGGHILDYVGIDAVSLPGPPLICVPTTAGSSADVSQFAIINDAGRRRKVAIISKAIVPDVALIDPETTITLSPELTVGTGLDALTHAIEAYVSSASSPISDLHALAAIRGIRSNLLKALVDPGDISAREELMLASLHAGIAFSNASLGLTHSMAHSLGGYLDLPHGECNALLLSAVVRFNFPATPGRYRRILEAFGSKVDQCDEAQAGVLLAREIDEFRTDAGLVGGLAQRGVSVASISDLAERAMGDGCLYTNPRRPSVADLKALYADAL